MPRLSQLNWETHKKRWSECNLCELCNNRKRIVLGRGQLPCNLLFVGEAPGVSEDTLGKPFVGPAGKLLDDIIREALEEWDVRVFFTNVVSCIPLDEEGSKISEPPKEAIKACEGRLRELIKVARPDGIVTVGKLAEKHLDTTLPTTSVIHPAAILRADITQQGLQLQRAVIAIKDFVEDLYAA